MAIVATVSIGTSNKVSVDYQSQEVSVGVTYQLEREDTDLLAFVHDKAAEVEQAHTTVWRRLRELRQHPPDPEAHGTPVRPGLAPPREAENPGMPPAATVSPGPTRAQQRALQLLAQRAGWTEETFANRLEARFGKRTLGQLTTQEAAQLLREMQRGTPEPAPAGNGRENGGGSGQGPVPSATPKGE